MRKIVAAVRMVSICCFISAYLLFFGTPILIYCRLRNDPRMALKYTRLLDRMVCFLAGIRVQVEGIQKLDPLRGCVYVGNHRSLADTTTIFLAVPADVRFLIKKELYKIPVLSFALRTMQMIQVDRSDHDAATKSIERAVSEIRAGRSIILFPEGTRSRTQEMLPFKKGAFVLAIKAQAPVVPFTLVGADRVIEPDTPYLYPGTIRVIFHDPIETTGLDLEDRNALLERARSIIQSGLEESQ